LQCSKSKMKKKMKTQKMKFGMMVLAATLTVGTVSCNRKGCTDPTATNYDEKAKKDDGSCVLPDGPVQSNVVLTGTQTTDLTLDNTQVYEIQGKFVIEDGATLTIPAGTIIKGAEGTGTLASALVIAQGGNINAVGTASQPIIFTSVLDNIQPGELTGTNLDEADKGLWGGLIVLGYAPISAGDGDVVSQIEGIPAGDTYGAFGGSDAADNSGTISYVSIRHGGALIGAGNEINGLTLGGVGTGTTINNVEIVANLDDGIEFFGGTVNVTNLLVGFQGDDGVDIDMNYSGTVDNFIVISDAGSDEGLEIDGPEGTTYTNGLFTLRNGSVYNFGGAGANGDFKSKAQGTIENVSLGNAKIRASYQNACVDTKTDAYTHLTNGSPTLVFTTSAFTGVTVYTASDDGATPPITCPVPATDQSTAESSMTSTTATGGSASGFASWTWAGVNGKL